MTQPPDRRGLSSDSWPAPTSELTPSLPAASHTHTHTHTHTHRHLTRWYSRVSIQGKMQEIADGLKMCMKAALSKYHEVSRRGYHSLWIS